MRESSSTKALSWVGSRCGIKTSAMPGSEGSARKRLLNDSRPPAEAPIATMGKVSGIAGETESLLRRGLLGAGAFFLFFAINELHSRKADPGKRHFSPLKR